MSNLDGTSGTNPASLDWISNGSGGSLPSDPTFSSVTTTSVSTSTITATSLTSTNIDGTDASFNTLQVWKTSPTTEIDDSTSNITGPDDDVNSTIFCNGDLACKGTLWAIRLRAQTRWTISDPDAKDGKKPLSNFMTRLRRLNVYQYHYKSDAKKQKTIGLMADEMQQVFTELVDTSQVTEGGYRQVNLDGVFCAAIGGLKEVDECLHEHIQKANTK